MAKYQVERTCGHVETVQLFGKMKDREWRLEREKERYCTDCYRERLQQYRAQQAQLAAQESKERGLPELSGTPKQIAWAETIRKKIVQDVERLLGQYPKLQESSWRQIG